MQVTITHKMDLLSHNLKNFRVD